MFAFMDHSILQVGAVIQLPHQPGRYLIDIWNIMIM